MPQKIPSRLPRDHYAQAKLQDVPLDDASQRGRRVQAVFNSAVSINDRKGKSFGMLVTATELDTGEEKKFFGKKAYTALENGEALVEGKAYDFAVDPARKRDVGNVEHTLFDRRLLHHPIVANEV